MTENIQTIRDKILTAMLPDVSKTGWSWEMAERAGAAAGYQDNMARAVFPGGLSDVVAHFADFTDRRMFDALKTVRPETLRVRDRIRVALQTRFDVLEEFKPQVRQSLAFWSLPTRAMQGQRVLWRTADRIWDWAGDTATDYNRQTKRGLLCSVLLSAALVWSDDTSEGHRQTLQFIDRRIENIMEFGKAIGTIKNLVPHLKRQTR